MKLRLRHELWVLLASVAGLVGSPGCSKKSVVAGFPPEYVGVGLEFTIRQAEPVVVRALPGGSAAQAGVLPGDRLQAIDGVPTRGQSLGDVVVRVRGAPGSQVTLTFLRGQQRLIVVLKRSSMAKTGNSYSPQSP